MQETRIWRRIVIDGLGEKVCVTHLLHTQYALNHPEHFLAYIVYPTEVFISRVCLIPFINPYFFFISKMYLYYFYTCVNIQFNISCKKYLNLNLEHNWNLEYCLK